MRVVVNQMAALGRKTGVGHYTSQLMRQLRAQAEPGSIDGFPSGAMRRACRALVRARPYLDGGAETYEAEVRPAPFLGELRKQTLRSLRQGGRTVIAHYFRSLCARERYDLYHEPNFVPFPCDRPTVATLHDLSVLLHPEWHPADRVAFYEEHFRYGLAHCQHYLVVSEFIRQEVIRTLNVPPDRVTRTYNGIRPRLGPLPREEVARTLEHLGLPPRYLLHLGTIEPRKNVLLLLKAYCALPERLRASWPLVLVGSWGWNAGAVADFLHREARHRGVIHIGYLKDGHLAAVYNGARALVYPTWYEGFGLPPLEMMACGGAVLASTAGALVETIGRQAHMIAPGDQEGWTAAMTRVLEDDDWWRLLRQGARAVAAPYTWERCAAETLALYRALCGEQENQAAMKPSDDPMRYRKAV
jgi:alpha-1,3-rhamnosyl/mannosyltransferase